MQPNRIRKSVGAENTFANDLMVFEEMKQSLVPTIDKAWRYCEGTGVRGRTVTLNREVGTGTLPITLRKIEGVLGVGLSRSRCPVNVGTGVSKRTKHLRLRSAMMYGPTVRRKMMLADRRT